MFSFVSDIPVTGVLVNCLKAERLAAKPTASLSWLDLPAGCDAVKSWCAQLSGDINIR